MAKCRSCKAENPQWNRFCGVCGAVLGSNSEVPTVLMSLGSAPASPSSSEDGRFAAGTVLSGRYRIIGLIGQGGMGEVYRASDLKLGQPVALKFLPAAAAGNRQLLARFHAEVRIARQVSHPNVCRVYDIGDVDGSTYLSMEYVDGEDLRSLLRRIGHLPGDKAIEIARKLCAGLAAAHEKGVLHRDLKPANIMIDGRGQVLITDFGLAALVGQLDETQVREGTPAYMAPEQLAGKEVSVRSDVYALGLVLHEMFTGKGAFENNSKRITPTSVSSSSKDIDPLVERVILRCLDVDPHKRPASALAVSAALPGGDPLALALAAGETPSPEMVAAAGATEGLPVGVAISCLGLVILGTLAAALIAPEVTALGHTRLEGPEVLAHKSREILSQAGYDKPPVFTAYGFLDDLGIYGKYVQTKSRHELLEPGQHRLISFWYRESPQDLMSAYPPFFLRPLSWKVTPDDPPLSLPNMVRVQLDPQGRLVRLEGVPMSLTAPQASRETVLWTGLLSAAGVDIARLKQVEPKSPPAVAFDSRVAWIGAYPNESSESLRIEAASRNGIPVYFGVLQPWFGINAQSSSTSPSVFSIAAVLILVLLLAVIAGALVLARHNIRVGRGDRRGASRLTGIVFAINLLGWIAGPGHVTSGLELVRSYQAICASLFAAGLLWVMYLALEPFARRGWPQALVSWSRALAGQFRDPRVGGDVLIGATVGVGCAVLSYTMHLADGGFFLETYLLENVLGARAFIGMLAANTVIDLFFVLFVFSSLFLLRKLLRKPWLAAGVVIALGTALLSGTGRRPEIDAVFGAAVACLFTFVLLRFGFLSAVVAAWVMDVLSLSPVTTSFSAWFAGIGQAAMLLVVALAIYAFRTTLAGRSLFKGGFLEPN